MATYNPTTGKRQLTIPSGLVLPTVLPGQDGPDTKKIIGNPVFKGDKIVGSTGTKIVSNTPEKTSVYDNVLGTAKGSNPVVPPVEESLESILASNKATLESNQNNQNNQTNTVRPVNNFVGTSPTSTTRVVKKELQKQQNDFTPPTYDEIATMDENKLYDAIDRLELKLNKNQELSDEETLSLKALQRQAKKIGTPQNLGQPVEQLVQEQKNDIIQTQEARAEQDIKELQAFVQSQEAYKQASLDLIEQEAQENIKTLGYILGAQGASTSSYGAEAIQKIQQTAMLQKQAKIAEIQAKIDLYGSQLRKDSQETIQNMKDKLYQTQMVSAQYDVENIRTVNEYNLKKSQSTVERLQNLEKLANEVIKSNRPLTEQEAQQAQSWAESLIKPDGSVDTTLLKILQETNPVIAGLALQQSVSTAKERINFAQQDNILNRKYKQAQIDKLNKEETGTRSKIDLPDGSTGLLNNKTGEVRNSTGASSIDRSTATQQYGTTPAIRNFNPGNITDLSFGGQKVAGERFTVFDSPEEGLQALVDKIQYNQTNPSSSYYGSTIASYFERYAPRGSNNPESYAQDVARKLGVNVNTPISQLSPDRFAGAIASHEDTNNFKMLKDLGLVNDDYSLNLYNPNTQQAVDVAKDVAQQITGKTDDVDIYVYNGLTPSERSQQQKNPAFKTFIDEKNRVMKDKNANINDILRYSQGGSNLGDKESTTLSKYGVAINQIGDLSDALKGENTGPLLGILRSNNPYDTKAQQIKSQLSAMIPNLARGVYGEVGVLTDNDIALYTKTVPNLKSTEDVNNAILSMTIKLLANGYKTQLQGFAASNNDVSGYRGLYDSLQDKANELLNNAPQQSDKDAELDKLLGI